MLKVKKKIPSTKNENQNEDVTQLHEEIKNSMKKIYLSDQKKKKKTTNKYIKIISKIRNEYDYNQLKTELQKYQNHVQNLPQKSHTKYQKPIRKRNTITMVIKKKAKTVILMLLKVEKDVQTNKEKG